MTSSQRSNDNEFRASLFSDHYLLLLLLFDEGEGKGIVNRDISTSPPKIMMEELTLLQEKELRNGQDSKITLVGKK